MTTGAPCGQCPISPSSATSPCRWPTASRLYADVYRPAGGGPHHVLLISQPYDKTACTSDVGYRAPVVVRAPRLHRRSLRTRAGRLPLGGRLRPVPARGRGRVDDDRVGGRLPGSTGQVATYGFSYAGLNQLLAAQRQPSGAHRDLAGVHRRPAVRGLVLRERCVLARLRGLLGELPRARRRGAARGRRRARRAGAGTRQRARGLYWVLPLTAYPPLAARRHAVLPRLARSPDARRVLGRPSSRLRRIDAARPARRRAGGTSSCAGRSQTTSTLARRRTRAAEARARPLAPHALAAAGRRRRARSGRTSSTTGSCASGARCSTGEQTGVFDTRSRPTSWARAGAISTAGRRRAPGRPTGSSALRRPRASKYGDRDAVARAAGGRAAGRLTYDPDTFRRGGGGHSCCLEALRADGASRPGSDRAHEARARLHQRAARARPRPRRRRARDPLRGDRARRTPTSRRGSASSIRPASRRTCWRASSAPATASRSSQPSPIKPGEVVEYRIELGPVGARVAAGHRLRLQVGSSDFPQWDRNLNTGGPIGKEPAAPCGPRRRSCCTTGITRSRLTLPVASLP